MRTSDYPYFQCKFFEFNTAQSMVVPYFDKDVNLIVAFPTSTGKTAIAECVFGYHLASNDRSKVVYISPYKGITAERQRDWIEDRQFVQHGVIVCTGDYHPSEKEYEDARVVLMTTEAFDNQTRCSGKRSWLSKVACVVYDEAHMIGKEGRGAAVEASMMRISRIAPSARFVLLSATMSNSLDLAKWVKTLNGKETKNIRSTWRPVSLKYRLHAYDDRGGWTQTNERRIKKAADVVGRPSLGQKVLVFVQSKKLGRAIAAELRKRGVRCGFHNASVSAENRGRLEQIFDDPYSGVDVLISTSTLSAGVNLGG
jgi:replicative superfamily II helicase